MTIPDTNALVAGQLKDLTGLGLGALPGHSDPALQEMLDRVLRRMDVPGASISGYNGAGAERPKPDSDPSDA